jgi:hypothetical protein
MKRMVVLDLWLVTVFCATVVAAPLGNVEKVQIQNGKVVVMQNGAAAFARENVTLPHGIVVDTNGFFRVNGGKPRQLNEGETLNREGMLLRADGSIMPVMDHVTLNRGRVVVMKDGELSDLKGTIKLGDGSVISDDAYITDKRGMRRKLLDGELFKTKGGALPARDTISMDGGRVTVQKDGSQIAVEPGRTITMNDGTKVFADGTVVRFDGTQVKLREGETLVIEGVIRRTP